MTPPGEIARRPLLDTVRRWTVAAAVVATVVQVLGIDRSVGVAADAMAVLFIVYLLRHLVFLAAAFDRTDGDAADVDPPAVVPWSASVLVPCHDEELVVDRLVAALAAVQPPDGGLEVILVDDRSTDRTPALLDAGVAGRPGWRALHRPPGARPGKSAALNDALAVARGDVVVVFDADHHPHPEAVRRLLRHFDDPTVAAAQGRCIVRNPGESPLARLVALDYLCGYLVNQVGRQSVFDLPAYGGANCAVRADRLRAVGGWNERSVTEDTDLTLRLVLGGDSVRYDVTALDSEQAVSTLARYWRQRYRWARGHQQVCVDQRAAVLRSPHLRPLQKLESLLFLFSFHLPVVCLAGTVLVALQGAGTVHVARSLDLWPLIPLMFAAPLVEIGGGLALAGVARRRALDLLLFPVLYGVSMACCTKAMVDRWAGRAYGWRKTERSPSSPTPAPAPVEVAV